MLDGSLVEVALDLYTLDPSAPADAGLREVSPGVYELTTPALNELRWFLIGSAARAYA
jgi:hypothetical protein